MGNSKVSRPIKNQYHTYNYHYPLYFNHLILFGYIRRIGQLYLNIPREIVGLVSHYYCSRPRLYWITMDNYIYTSDFTNKPKQKMTFESPTTDRYYMDGSLCINRLSWNKDVIYKCGGIRFDVNSHFQYAKTPTDACYSITINREKQNILKIDTLPNLPENIAGNCLLYDDALGLLSIGGYAKRKPEIYYCGESQEIRYYYTPSLNAYQLSCSKWKRLPSMEKGIYFPSGIVVENCGSKHIMVFGGSIMPKKKGWEQTSGAQMNIFNFETNKWRQIRTRCFSDYWYIHRPGICFNEIYNRLYVVGGGSIDRVYEYDHIKNRWSTSLPTKLRNYPTDTLIWFDTICHDLLFVADPYYRTMECIDVREGKKWKVLSRRLEHKFGILRREHLLKPFWESRLLFT